MALALDPVRVVAPLSSAAPCGEDLDAAGDLDFLNHVSHIESVLPPSFFTRDDEGRVVPFDRASIDFDRESKVLLALLERSHDLRILTLLGRLAMLDRDLAGFADVLTAVAELLEAHWDDVHPRADGESYELRGAVLQSLDDVPTVVLPLQHIVLAQSRRHGPISFRSVMTAAGEVPPREGEPTPDRGSIDRAIEEADPDALRTQVDRLTCIADSVKRIASVTVARGGYSNAVSLDRLAGLVGRIRELLDRAELPTEPGADQPEEQAGVDVPKATVRLAGAIGSTTEAAAALLAAAAYLRRQEPSSPAEVLVRQAQMLVGKSFLEVMRILVPARAEDAMFALGPNRGLRLTFDQLASVPDIDGDHVEIDPRREESETQSEAGRSSAVFVARTRADAMALLKDVGAFFRAHEPTSPIPLLLDKAVGIADRDFLAILRDVLPDLVSE